MERRVGLGHPLVRSLFGLGIGAVLFLVMMVELPASPGGAGARVWVADRDGDAVVGLDADGFVVERLPVRAPVGVAVSGDGLFVASSVEGWALGEHQLVGVSPGGGTRVLGAGLGPVMDLEVLPDGGALLVELGSGGAARVLRSGVPGWGLGGGGAGGGVGAGGVSVLAEVNGGCCAAGRSVDLSGSIGTEVLVGDWGGGGTLLRDGVQVLSRQVGGELGDVAAGPGGTWFLLEVASPGRLHLLDSNLAVLWSVEHGLASEGLGVVPGEERVWLVDSAEPLARRFGPGGALELEVPLLGSDASGVLAEVGGGAWITTPGAVLRIGGDGNSLPGQGGFDYLVDVDG